MKLTLKNDDNLSLTSLLTVKVNKAPVSQALQPILVVGKVFGLIIQPKTSSGSLAKNIFRLAYPLYTFCANLLIFIFAIIIFLRDLGSSDEHLVEQFLDIVYHCHILITIITCAYHSNVIPLVLEEWYHAELLLQKFESNEKCNIIFQQLIGLPLSKVNPLDFSSSQFVRVQDKNSHKKFVRILFVITGVYVSCIFIGAVSYFASVSIKENSDSFSNYLDEVAKIYVIEEACGWWTGFYVLFIGHILELIWAYGDMLILSISVIMWYQFKRFNKIISVSFFKEVLTHLEIENLRLLHCVICKAAKKTRNMLNVLTTTVFICNILYLFSRVYNGLEEDLNHPNWFINFEAIYAFSYLIVRIFSTALVATKLFSESIRSCQLLSKSDFAGQTEMHNLLINRFFTQLLTVNVAMSGSGYFYLNRGFIATLISALITYEIVILQFSYAAHRMSASPSPI